MVCSQEIKNELLSIFPPSLHTMIKFIVCEYYSEFIGEEIDQIETRKFMIDNKQNYIYSCDRGDIINIYSIKDAKFFLLYSYDMIIPNLRILTDNLTTSLFVAEKDHAEKQYYLFDTHFCKLVATIESKYTTPKLVGHDDVTYIMVICNFTNENKTGFWYQTYEETKQFGEIQFVETLHSIRKMFILEEYGCVVTDSNANVYTYKINSKTKQLEMIKQTCQKGYHVQDVKFGYLFLSEQWKGVHCWLLNAETHDVLVNIEIDFENQRYDRIVGRLIDQSTNYLLFWVNEIFYLFDNTTKNITEIGEQSEDFEDMMFLQNGDLVCFSVHFKVKKPLQIQQTLFVLHILNYHCHPVSLMSNNYLLYAKSCKLHLIK